MTEVLDREAVSSTDGEPCHCGSGLMQNFCCGLDLRTVKLVPPEEHEDQLTELARAYRAGDNDTVRQLATDVLHVSPGQRDALGGLFNVLRDAGNIQAAAAVMHRMALIHKNDAVTQMVAARFFLVHNSLVYAQAPARMLVRLAPHDDRAHAIMGRVFLLMGKAKAAEHHLRLSIELIEAGKTPDIQVEADLARALRDQDRLGEARSIFTRLTVSGGEHVSILLDWAELEETARDFAAAFALLDRAEALAPGDARIGTTRAGLHRRVNQPEAALTAISAVVDGSGGAGLLRKGQILDSLGRYDEAFETFTAYKARLRETSRTEYLADDAERQVASLKQFFTPSRARLLPRAELRADSAQPIFIVGFPRSGTTLVEQTLSAHPSISAGDELPIIASITRRAQMLLASPNSYPAALGELWMGDRRAHIDTLRDLYLNDAALIGAIVPGKRWFTDKMPLNETDLGLISLLFPRSPVIHLVRHPLDVVLSVFSNGLTHGFYCAYALESAARHYALIADLIAHYRAAMPINYHAVRYEDLVTDQEREVRAMLEFIGEPYDPRVLAFQDNARHARTASYAQVTEKLYDRSRYRYRNYLKHLEPVIPILEPAIQRLGYTIDV